MSDPILVLQDLHTYYGQIPLWAPDGARTGPGAPRSDAHVPRHSSQHVPLARGRFVQLYSAVWLHDREQAQRHRRLRNRHRVGVQHAGRERRPRPDGHAVEHQLGE